MGKGFVVAVLAAALLAGALARPAPAVVHEIVAAWCNGKGELIPPGLSREGSQNFAMPVGAGGVAAIVPYLDGFLLDIDFSRPQAKVSPPSSGPLIVQVAPGFYVERFELDHVAFDNCTNFSG